jgi:hypothetical protein
MEDERDEILAWVVTQHLLPGTDRDLVLPAPWEQVSHQGIIHAARTTDGRHCILLKRHVGWKGNFEGWFYCEKPLTSRELVELPTGIVLISLPGLGVFEELYVRQRRSDRLFEVYFDLN